MARDFAAAGYAVLRFDYRGMGDSSGGARPFDDVQEDIRSAIDTLHRELPSIRCVVAFGLCDAASAAVMYDGTDPRVRALILANPWVRTDAGEARARLQHYYGQRLLSRAFWTKVVSGQFAGLTSLRDLLSALRRGRGAATRAPGANASHFVDRMLAGLAGKDCPLLLLMSERDLTAREFDDLCRSSETWANLISSPRVRRFDVPGADHTFSVPASLAAATAEALRWLRDQGAQGSK
jgi:exosortase A-associated hydrolase 1